MDKLVKIMLVKLIDILNALKFSRKINKIIHSIGTSTSIKISSQSCQQHVEYFKKFGFNITSQWYRAYASVSKKSDVNFIPEPLYYFVIERVLNNRSFSRAYADKNFYQKYLGEDYFPKTILRLIDGVFYDAHYTPLSMEEVELDLGTELVIKPSINSAGGRDIRFGKVVGKKQLLIENSTSPISIIDMWKESNLLFQESVKQAEFFSQFNKSSVNTVRVFTYRSVKDNRIHALHCILRVGKTGRKVDNQAAGGVSVGINLTGRLNNFCVDKYGDVQRFLNGIDLGAEHVIPNFAEILLVCKKIAGNFFYDRLLGFDVSLDQNQKVKILEINNVNNEINFLQMNNGSLFGEFTEEILIYASQNQRNIVIDFSYR